MTNLINILTTNFHHIWAFLGSNPFILFVMTFSFIVKLLFIINLIIHMRNNNNIYIKRSCFFLIIVLSTAMMANSSWILKIVRRMFIPSLNYDLCVLWLRVCWSFALIQYHSLSLFIESLVEKNNLFCMRQKILISITLTFFSVLLFFSIFSYKVPFNIKNIELKLIGNILQYCTFPLLSLSIFFAIKKIKSNKLPRLLKIQTKIFIKSTMFPFLILELINIYPVSLLKNYLGNSSAFSAISTLILLYAIFYCSRKIIGLRFLNMKSHVISGGEFNFIIEFRHVLDQFSNVTNLHELNHITNTFFKQAFNIPNGKTNLYIIEKINNNEKSTKTNYREKIIKKLISSNQFKIDSILFTDEVEFNQFYNNTNSPNIIKLLTELYADIFIPIIFNNKLVAYIIIDRFARSIESDSKEEFYTELERDSMLVFTEYLKNIIQLLYNKNFESIISKEKSLKELIYFKHQEINQYKESIRSFLHSSYEKKIGILFYKNRHFILGNKIAQDMIQVDINTHCGHPTTKKLKTLTQQVFKYKSPQTCFIFGNNNEKLIVSGIPNIKQNNIIITIHKPEISDFLSKKIELLHDPNNWNFLLCLETTKTGKKINQLIPNNGETFLNFKINLLKASLEKKAILINAPDGDIQSIVELLNNANLRENLYTINLNQPIKTPNILIQLFGINPLLSFKNTEKPLIERLNNNGTLFIKNIDFLDIETQNHLAEFIKHGVYRKMKSDHKISSNVKIICSTNKNLSDTVQEGTFSKSLFDELNKNILIMPSITAIKNEELKKIINTLSSNALKTDAFGKLLELSKKEKQKLLNSHTSSLYELKLKIKQLLIKKSKQNSIETEDHLFNPAYFISDPDIIEATQLGKHALKNPQIMSKLWKKFKSQNKIAMFLGVNRSSVSRRCKKYGLI